MLKAWSPRQLRLNPIPGAPVRVARLPRRARPSAAPQGQQPGDADVRPSGLPPADELPPELKDVGINEDGFLIDTKTGKVINEMGATRFDVAVRALRGELDPPEWVENSERTPGVILSALYQFPRSYLFQVVGRPDPADAVSTSPLSESSAASPLTAASFTSTSSATPAPTQGGKASFVEHVTATIARVTQSTIDAGQVEVKERLGGKYVSVGVEVVVRAPELVNRVYEELGTDPRVLMKF